MAIMPPHLEPEVIYRGSRSRKTLHGLFYRGNIFDTEAFVAIDPLGGLCAGLFAATLEGEAAETVFIREEPSKDGTSDLLRAYRIMKVLERLPEFGNAALAFDEMLGTEIPPDLDRAIEEIRNAGVELNPVVFEIEILKGRLRYGPHLASVGVRDVLEIRKVVEPYDDEIAAFLAAIQAEEGSPLYREIENRIVSGLVRGIRETDMLLGYAFVGARHTHGLIIAEQMAAIAIEQNQPAAAAEYRARARERLRELIRFTADHLAGRQKQLRSDLAPRPAAGYERMLFEIFREEEGIKETG